MTALLGNEENIRWYVMRDLKRANAKEPAYKLLEGMKMAVFVPMKWRLVTHGGVRIREEVPFMPDLLFVHERRITLDPIVEKIRTLQYRWLRRTWREPMTVADGDMERFIHAVNAAENPKYYQPDELTPDMYGRSVRIVGGAMDGYSGKLLSARGSKFKRLMVEIPNLLTAAVEVNPEFIIFI